MILLPLLAAAGLNMDAVAAVRIGTNDVSAIDLPGAGRVWQRPAPLPYDAEVEYVRTDGFEYINTGILPDSTIRIECEWKWNTIVAQARLFSSNSGGSNFNLEYSFYRGRDAISARCGDSRYASTFVAGTDGMLCSLDYRADTITFNSSAKTNTAPSHPSGTVPIALFGRNNLGTVLYSDYKMLCDFYWMKITLGGVLVRDYIPVRVGTAGALYDRVSGTLFYSATSTPLVAGPDKPD